MTEWLRFGFSAFFLILGSFSFVVGIFGLYKFGFVLNRMHSSAVIDTCGLLFTVIGIVISRGVSPFSIKLILIVCFLWLTSPISSHLIAKTEFFTDRSVGKEIKNDINDIKDKMGGDKDEYRDL